MGTIRAAPYADALRGLECQGDRSANGRGETGQTSRQAMQGKDSGSLATLGGSQESTIFSRCLSCLLGDLLDEASCGGWRQCLAAQLVHDLQVVLHIGALVQVD